MSDLFFLLFHDTCYFSHGLFLIDHTGRIIRSIHDHCFCFHIDRFFKSIQIGLECFIVRCHCYHFCIEICRIAFIFPEKWCKYDHLIPRIQDRFKNDIQTACSSDCHNNIMCVKRCCKPFIQIVCNRLPHILISRIVHISMEYQRICFLHKFLNRQIQGFRCRCRRIAKRKVIDIFLSDPGCQFISFYKHCTDRRASL